jgi:hypothetical protein
MERIDYGDPIIIYSELKLFSEDRAPVLLSSRDPSIQLHGWDIGGRHVLYSTSLNRAGMYMVDRDGTNDTYLVDATFLTVYPESGKILYYSVKVGQYVMRDLQDPSWVRFLNFSEYKDIDNIRDGTAYGYRPGTGVVGVNLSTMEISTLWPMATGPWIDIVDVRQGRVIAYCQQQLGGDKPGINWGLYIIDMTAPSNFSITDLRPTESLFWERVAEQEPDISGYQQMTVFMPVLISPLAILVLVVFKRGKRRPGR